MKDVTCTTQYLQKGQDVECYTESYETKDCSVNTELLGTSVDFGCDIKPTENNDVFCNTEFSSHQKDFTCNTQIATRKDFTCNTKIYEEYKDFTSNTCTEFKDTNCNTDVKETSEICCETSYKTVSEGTQKNKMDGVKMAIKNIRHADIHPHSNLKKSSTLTTQLLPSINIMSKPTFQKILHFYIDQDGNTHIEFRFPDNKNGYYEVQSLCSCEQSKIDVDIVEYKTEDDSKKDIQIQSAESSIPPVHKVSSLDINQSSSTTVLHVLSAINSTFYIESQDVILDTSINPNKPDLPYSSNLSLHSIYNLDGKLQSDMQKSFNLDFAEPISTMDSLLSINTNSFAPSFSMPSKESAKTSTKASTDIDKDLYKEMVLKSYQLYDNKNIHDPSLEGVWSPFGDKPMDEVVYKTFINPKGITAHSILKQDKKKKRELVADRSLQTITPTPSCSLNPSVLSTIERKSTKEHLDVNKLFSLGLYESRETQCDWQYKDYEKSYERISLTISYSSSSDALEDDQNRAREEKEIHFKNRLVTDLSSKEMVKNRFPASAEETFRQLKEKIMKEHPTSAISAQDSMTRLPDPFKENKNLGSIGTLSYIEGPLYVSEILQKDQDEIKKYVPHIKQSMRTSTLTSLSKSTESHRYDNNHEEEIKYVKYQGKESEKLKNKLITVKNNPEIKRKSNHRKSGVSHNFTTLPVHIQGDSILVDKQRVIEDLYVDKNGRYKDEKNLFSEKKFKELDFSTSTGTTEKSFSDGEIQCHCSVSNGEIHVCKKGSPFKNLRKSHSFRKDFRMAAIQKRRHYLSNMITYYFANSSNIQDSSSTS